ncbi:protein DETOXIFICATION 46, chloroplastic-like [Salvia splendens]|nr:protein DETOXIFICATION 46, chloroplastic-like [Salvia splendens]
MNLIRAPIHHPYHLNPRTLTRRSNRVSIATTPIRRFSEQKINRIFISNCFSPTNEVGESIARISPIEEGNDESFAAVAETQPSEETSDINIDELSENDSLWIQMVEIAKFSGPAVGLWICAPLMSLIDTAVIGQCSSVELAALGPGTVFCDYTSYVFMFLSIATSNLVATSLASKDKDEVQHKISNLLSVGLACGIFMLFFTRCFGTWGLTAFTGANNPEIIAAANTYVQIRGLAWPAVLIGWVAQSASLGMKDSWGPLKALVAASAINGIGDIILCRFLGYGIAGAAWATMVSQVVASWMMIEALNIKGYNGYSISLPSPDQLLEIFMLAAPVFVTMMSKVMFYSLLVYFATSKGTKTLAAHQVMMQVYGVFTVFGEPISQTAQSFMPELLYGVNRNLKKAQSLLKSLLIIGVISGLILGSIGASIPWLFPRMFSPDPKVIQEMHKVLIPFFLALCITPGTHSLEGSLMAGRDLKFISMSMSAVFVLGSLILLFLSNSGYGIAGFWFTLVAFQWSRFCIALRRLTLPTMFLYSGDLSQSHYQTGKLKSV